MRSVLVWRLGRSEVVGLENLDKVRVARSEVRET